MKQIAAAGLAGLLILGAGAVHGYLTLRWSAPVDAQAAAARVPEIPMSIGKWDGVDLPVSEYQMSQTEAYGYISRRYTNRENGQAISVMLLCGRTGPLSVHSPTVCFTGTGFEVQGEPRRFSLTGDATSEWGALWTADFVRTRPTEVDKQRVFWGWSGDAVAWQAPDYPRVTFVGLPYLYKLYVVREVPSSSAAGAVHELIDDDPCVEFLRVFAPEAQRALRGSNARIARTNPN